MLYLAKNYHTTKDNAKTTNHVLGIILFSKKWELDD